MWLVLIAAFLIGRVATARAQRACGSLQSGPRGCGPSLAQDPPWRGLLVWVVVLLGVVALWWLMPDRRASSDTLIRTGVILAAAWCLGYACDRYPVPRWLRIGLVFLVCFATAMGVTSFSQVKAPFSTRFLSLGPLAIPLTTVWLFVVCYALFGSNLLPGLLTGLTGVITPTLFTIGLIQPQMTGGLATTLVTPLAGYSLGQLCGLRNGSVRRTDSGTALSLGLAVAIVTVSGALKNTVFLVFLLPMLILGTPLVDVGFALLRRKAPTEGRQHDASSAAGVTRLHRVLLEEGITQPRVVSLLIALNASLCVLAILLVLMIRVHFVGKLILLLPSLLFCGLFFFCLFKLFSRRTQMKPDASIYLLGIPISPLSMSETMEQIKTFIASRKPHLVVTSDTSLLVRAQSDPELLDIVQHADLVTADGIGVVLSARLLDLPVFERVSGCDMVEHICRLAGENRYRVFFLGAAPGIAEQAAVNLKGRYPGMVIAGTLHGYFKPGEEAEVVEQIRQSHPDVLFVALGIPRQEKFICKHMQSMQVPVCLGVGGSFDVYAGAVKRAPAWVQRVGFEWLYRSIGQPKRWGRLMAIPRLLFLTFRHLLGKKHH